jgi:hypothetical protein
MAMSEQTNEHPIDFTQQHEEIAAKHGFRLSKEHGSLDFYRKDNADGSFWLASTASELPFRLAPPENHIFFIGRFMPGENGEAQVVVHETLPIDVLLSEHQRIPAPSFDSDGDPIEKHFDTWTELHWEGHRGKPSWDKFEKVTKSIPGLAAMFDEGFHLTMTGGGCTAFELFDDETDTLWLVSSDSSVDAHPLSVEWIVGRYRNVENGGDECISVSNTTIQEIIARYRDIPVPQVGQEDFYWHFGSWDQLDAHIYETGQAVRPA